MRWLIDDTGAAYRWDTVTRIYPSVDNQEVLIETADYRVCTCRTPDARAMIRRILELELRDANVDVTTLGSQLP